MALHRIISDPATGTINDMSKRSSPSPSKRSGSGRIRLIGGRFKRRQLSVLDSPGLRPTPDRVRETLFNWLSFEIAGARILDPFSGSGALAFEAISRGASQALMIERDRKVAHLLKNNADTLGINDSVEILNQDALKVLARPADKPFDIVFLDPPFHRGLASQAIPLLEDNGWLAPQALIYVESESHHPAQAPIHWEKLRTVQAGESQAALYRREAHTHSDNTP